MSKKIVPIRRALISVYDKTGLIPFVSKLIEHGIEIVSTGNTAKAIFDAGLKVKEVQDVTGFPEMLDGRVKTLHPMIHGGILARRDKPSHLETLKKHKIPQIDLVVISLYPFEETMKKSTSHEACVEMIDVGGPTMLRAAAKNYASVGVLCDAKQYDIVLNAIELNGGLTLEERQSLAARVFETSAKYDSIIASYMNQSIKKTWIDRGELTLSFTRVNTLRYGENPHQKSSVYAIDGIKEKGLTQAKILGGKELSYNNYLDLDAAWSLVSAFAESATCVIKHNNPCGFAIDDNTARGFKKAFEGDPLSAFGGIVGMNRRVHATTAQAIIEAGFLECVLAPSFEQEAITILKQKKNLRIISMPVKKVGRNDMEFKRITGGLLVQQVNSKTISEKDMKVVTKKKISKKHIEDLLIGFQLLPFIKSNGIALIKNKYAVGIGMGQPSRVDSVMSAIKKAGKRANGSVLASDGFFPKADSIQYAAKHGVVAVIQPGGSIQDVVVTEACDKAGIPMVVTGVRHFSH